jgi:hypothetical protein
MFLVLFLLGAGLLALGARAFRPQVFAWVMEHKTASAAAAVFIAGAQNAAFASTTIELDTDTLFTQINVWITNLFPIFAIGGGIAIAIVVISFIIRSIVDAFKGAGKLT